MIKLEEISYEIKDTTILKGVNFEIIDNKINFIVGRSGSGKTTLLQIIGGMQKQSSGYIKRKDIELSKDELRGEVSFIFQNFALINNMKVKDNILLGLTKITSDDKKRMLELCKTLSIDHIMKKKVKYISGGEKQRVAIARAIIMDKNILLCDEPTGNLDYETALEIMKLLRSLKKTIVMVTHDKSLINAEDNILEIY